MQADAGPNTHALSPPAESIETGPQISAHFSTITYNKGASICRMMNGFLTEEVFINGLIKYLKEFAFQNVNKDDLFTILHQEALPATLPPGGVTVNAIMDTWVTQSGYPIVTATRAAATPTLIKLTQNKYGGNPTPPVHWWIPIALVSKGYDTFDPAVWIETKTWMHSADIDHTVTIAATDWYLVNPTMIGNYRVLYDNENFGLIIAQLNEDHSKIDPLSRSALLDDYFNLAFSNQGVQIDRSLELTKYLNKERHLVPWVTFFTNMAQSYRMLGRSGVFLNYRNYLLSLIEPALEDIKMTPQPGEAIGATVLLRNRLVEWACDLGSQACINFAKESVANWMTMENATRNNPISPDLRPTLYCAAMANGGDEVWNFFVARYADAHLATSSKYLPDMARISLVRALGCSKQSYRLTMLLDLVLDNESFLRPEHRLTAIQAVAGNSAGVDLTFNFIRNEFDTLVRRRGVSMFSSTVATLSNYMNTELAHSDLNAFIMSKETELESVRSSLNSSLANIQRNIDWISDHLERIRTFMNANTILNA
jgi:aminopeptidase N